MNPKILVTILMIASLFSCKKDTEVIPVVPVDTTCVNCCGIQPTYSTDNLSFVVDGNSMVQGWYVPIGLPDDYSSNYPDYIESVTGVPTENLGYSGITIWQMAGRANYIDYYISDSTTTVLIVDEATNSIGSGADADSTYKGFVKYCQDRRIAHPNVKIIVLAPTPRASNLTPSNFEIERQKLLQMLYQDFDIKTDCYTIRKSSQPMYADLLVDLASDSSIGYPGAENDTTYYWDKLHHTPAGYHIRGDRVMTALNVLLK